MWDDQNTSVLQRSTWCSLWSGRDRGFGLVDRVAADAIPSHSNRCRHYFVGYVVQLLVFQALAPWKQAGAPQVRPLPQKLSLEKVPQKGGDNLGAFSFAKFTHAIRLAVRIGGGMGCLLWRLIRHAYRFRLLRHFRSLQFCRLYARCLSGEQ